MQVSSSNRGANLSPLSSTGWLAGAGEIRLDAPDPQLQCHRRRLCGSGVGVQRVGPGGRWLTAATAAHHPAPSRLSLGWRAARGKPLLGGRVRTADHGEHELGVEALDPTHRYPRSRTVDDLFDGFVEQLLVPARDEDVSPSSTNSLAPASAMPLAGGDRQAALVEPCWGLWWWRSVGSVLPKFPLPMIPTVARGSAMLPGGPHQCHVRDVISGSCPRAVEK